MINTVFPEVAIFNAIKNILHVLREDYVEAVDKDRSLLNLIIGVNKLQRYVMLTQAVEVFTKPINKNEPRYLDVYMGFDRAQIQKRMPSINILLQDDTLKDNSLGLGEGNVDYIKYEEEDKVREFHERSYTSQINLMIISDNSNECILIYRVLKSILTSYIPYMENVFGFRNINMSGADIQLNTQVPGNMFFRNLSIRFDYSTNTPKLDESDLINKIFYTINVEKDGEFIKVAEFPDQEE